MTDRRIRIAFERSSRLVGARHDTPFGPMVLEPRSFSTRRHPDPFVLTGPAIGRVTLAVPTVVEPVRDVLREQLRQGVTLDIEGVAGSLSMTRRGRRRSKRVLLVERAHGQGEDDPGWTTSGMTDRTIRLRRLGTYSLEDTRGRPLVQLAQLPWRGRCRPGCHALDVATLLLAVHAGLTSETRREVRAGCGLSFIPHF